MNIAAWVAAILLAAVNLGAGLNKIGRPREALRTQVGAWVDDFSDNALKGIGAAEVLGAFGLILPRALDIVPVLTPLAAVGTALLQVGAFITHFRRGEMRNLPVNVIIFALAVFVAAVRFAG